MATNHINERHKDGRKKSTAQGGGRRSRKKAESQDFGMSQLGEQASRYWEQGTSHVRELTRDREATALLVALASGFGVGLVLGSMIGSSTQRPKTWSQRLAAEGIGHRLLERIEGMIPDAITDRLSYK